jgi:hypothetical protein
VAGWYATNSPNPASSGYLFDLTLLASKAPGTTQPVLELHNLRLALAS